MRFIVDSPVSPFVARGLADEGHEACHVRDYKMESASDEDILARALAEDRIIVSADRDFGTLLAFSGATRPSVILFRGRQHAHPTVQLRMILASLEQIGDDLDAGCVLVFREDQRRVRRLPIIRQAD